METDKKVTKRVKRVEHTPILTVEPEEKVIATQQPVPQETQPQPPQQNPQKPAFTAPDQTQTYRDLLLERPGVPCITNIQEAIAFVGLYEKWNSKVKLNFK